MFCLSETLEQLSFTDKISSISSMPTNNAQKFIELLNQYFDLNIFIPDEFKMRYYSSKTNTRDYSLESMISSLLLIHFFNFASVSNFIVLLTFSKEIREFCRFENDKIPDESVFSKFKTQFDKELLGLFNNISTHVIQIFSAIDDALPNNSALKGMDKTLIYDTTGLKPKVKENNPKYIASAVKKQTAFKKKIDNKGFNPELAAYKNLPKKSYANPNIKLDYSNGHFGYFYKFGILTNGYGIPLHIHFLDDEFYNALPDSYETMQEQKSTFDNASLKPVLTAFSNRVEPGYFNTFMADSEFDSYDNYGLLESLKFKKVLIPINPRNSKKNNDVLFKLKQESVPTCPKDKNLPFISDGVCNGKNRSIRLKFVCPKSLKINNRWTSTCSNKCRETNSTVTTYVYPNGSLRTFFGVVRGSDAWIIKYKKRTIIERQIASLKSHPAIDKPVTTNCASMRSDVFLQAITKLIVVILAHSVQKPKYLANLKILLRNIA